LTERKLFSALFVVAAVLAASALGLKQSKTQAPHAAPGPISPANSSAKKAEEQFKNIQVLKGIPADQLIPTMQFISASLGVECDFCHDPKAFDKDDKKNKQTARKMMDMMFAINKDNFEGHREVTCYSCHRGNAHPQAIPAVATEQATAAAVQPQHAEDDAAEAKENSAPAANQLVEKYVRALGGSSAIDKVTTRVMKGTIDFGGKSLPIDIYCKAPDERISFTHMPEGDNVTAFNGYEGWLGMPGRPIREMHGSDLDGASIDANLHLATQLEKMFSDMRTRGMEMIGDQEAFQVIGQREGKPPIRLYFDQQSGLLVRMIRYGDTALGLIPTQIDYADYRDVSGLKVPYRWTLARPGGRFTIQVSEVQQNVPVDDAKFVKPAPPAAPAK
jgi:hypothetical protein